MKKLRILLSNETYPPHLSGAAKFTERLAKGLATHGHEVAVIAPGIKFKDEIEEKDNVKIFRMRTILLRSIHPYFRKVCPVGINERIGRIIQDFSPEIIHIQNHFTLGKACLRQAKKLNIPIMGTNHFMPENLLEYLPGILQSKASNLMWRGFLKIYNRLDYVTAPTNVAVDMAKKVGLEVEISAISNGIDLQEFKKSTIKDAIFRKFKLDRKLFTFIFVGRLEKDKNVGMTLESAKIALQKNSFQIVIAGKGRAENELKAASRKLALEDKIIFTGEVSDGDLKQLLSLSNAYIASGTAELQGIAVMEAMAHSLPILAVNAVALPELVKDGINGFLFNCNKQDLAEKMSKMLSLDKKELAAMGQRSLALIQDHTQEETLRQFETLYEKLINKAHLLLHTDIFSATGKMTESYLHKLL